MQISRPVTDSADCPACQDQRLVERKAPVHVVHGFLTFISVGVWGIVWAFLTMKAAASPYRCQTCGTKLVRIEQSDGTIEWQTYDR